MKLTADLIVIVRTGCGLIIDAKKILTTDLIAIANTAVSSGAKVTFTGVDNKLTTDLIAIGNTGKGNIVLDFR